TLLSSEFALTFTSSFASKITKQSVYKSRGTSYCESFNERMRDELLNGEIFYSLREAQIIIESWRKHYNTKRPHSALGYRPPARETIVPMETRPIMQ
ncbi:transposase, partial [uncultured Pelagimonas sp.]|uniref:integrase core domain-containing protein n=1 Tax=uncultured Pelagimonas sp. TaxID=1618102 RepID=UPI00262DCF96